ncbi:predicted protein [Coccidioides posadasii str. Silveira]|uniref:Predicted protein n=1 Tax=Coccidioides posadasii (strain RMSCC 757 / Silveira) TaxID=443226 RepID=E9CWU3_COCPS|nr:predicted protein [Coccidioides posadasii str. Silveira]
MAVWIAMVYDLLSKEPQSSAWNNSPIARQHSAHQRKAAAGLTIYVIGIHPFARPLIYLYISSSIEDSLMPSSVFPKAAL